MKNNLSLLKILPQVLLSLAMSSLALGQAPRTTAANVQGVPRLVKFSGLLKDASGNVLTNTVGITFAIYSERTGGAPLWQETQNVQFSQGRYTALLGETTSSGIPAELFASGQPRWLGVKPLLSGEEEQPRVQLSSVPYALKAVDADTLGGLPASAFLQAAGTNSTGIIVAPGTTAEVENHRSVLSNVTTNGGTVDTIPYFSTSSDIESSTMTYSPTSGVVGVRNLENVLYADQFTGTGNHDIGDKINQAYAACPSSGGGCHIVVAPAAYPFSTPIVFNGGHGPAELDCSPGSSGLTPVTGTTQLTYTGMGSTTAILFNDGGFTGAGMRGCTLIGPSSSGATIGLACGSGGGSCVGHYFEANDISGFGVGVQLGGALSFLDTFSQNTIHDSKVNVNVTGSGTNESNKFIGGLISNQSAIVENCVDTSSAAGAVDFQFIGVSLDGCGVNVNGTSSIGGHRFRFFGDHFENPAGASATNFITMGPNCSGCYVELHGTDIQEDGAPTGRGGLIQVSNTTSAYLYIFGGRFYAGGESPAPYIVDVTAGNNVVSVLDTENSAINAAVNNALDYSVLNGGILTLGGVGVGITVNGASITAGGGAPSGNCTGSTGIYLRNDATSASTVLYVCHANTWTAVSAP